jgi:hypothetical protein
MQVGQPLDRIGQGLLVEFRVLRADTLPHGAVGSGSEFEAHNATPFDRLVRLSGSSDVASGHTPAGSDSGSTTDIMVASCSSGLFVRLKTIAELASL